MGQAENVRNLPIHQQIESFYALFEELSKEDNGVHFVEKAERIKIAVDFISKTLKGKNLELIPIQPLDAINTHLSSIISNFNNYKTHRRESSLDTAETQIDSILLYIPNLTFPYIAMESKVLEAGIDSFLIKARDFDSYIEKKTQELNSNIEKTDHTLSGIQRNIDNCNQTIEQQKTRLDAAIQTTLETFTTSQKSREAEFSSLIANFKNADEKLNKDITKQVEEKFTEIQKQANDILNILEEKKKQASDLVQIVSNIGVTGNFNKYAEQQKKTANILRRIAIGSMVLLVVGTGWIIYSINQNEFDWQVSLFKFFSIGILTVPATYLAKESSKHRNLEFKYRKMELEIASLDPFMENLPVEERNALKTELIKRMFGKEEEKILEKDTNNTTSGLLGAIQDLINLIKQIIIR
jgi:hypothetical protein